MGAALLGRSLSVLVVDASVVVAACLAENGWTILEKEELVVEVIGPTEVEAVDINPS